MSPRNLLLSACALLPLTGCAVVALMTPARSFPQTSGEVTVAGIAAPVRILRDEHGVPHIRAGSEDDLWFGVGFVHAQDRLFQMDLIRRLGAGRTAEWFGERAVDFDLFMRSLEMDKVAQRRLPTEDPALVRAGEAYTRGVNAGAAALPALPIEYRLLGLTWEPWRLTDATSANVINSWTLNENAATEIVTLILKDRLNAAQVDALWRWDREAPAVDPYWDTLRHADVGALNGPFRGLVSMLWGVNAPSASNNWAIGGARTADGKPILASDPHLMQLVPSVWHVMEGKGGGYHVAGATLAGTPFPAVGHNEHTAWGVTNVMADYVDVALVERVGERGYRLAGEEKALREVKVQIKVKGRREPVERTALVTELGPVITEPTGTHLAVLRWNMLEAEDHTSDMFYALQRARSVGDVAAAAALPSMISQNLVSADVDGGIVWQAFGSIPARRGFTGRVPYPASDAAFGWDGWLTGLPGELNPPRGYVATANTKPEHPLADAISTAYIPDFRLDRIRSLIEATPAHTPESVQEIQLDWWDGHAAERVPQLLEGVAPEYNTCARLLLTWDHASGPDSQGAAVWAVFQGALIERVVGDALGEVGLDLYQAAVVAGRSVLDADLDVFVDDRHAAVRDALDVTCATLEAELGDDPKGWTWGRLHPLRIRHPFAMESDALGSFNMPERPYGGSHNTVNQSGYSWHNETLEATWIASLRLVVPMSDPGRATFIYPGGEAGLPGHPHFADLFETYMDGRQLPLYFHDDDVEAHAVETLVLRPVGE